MVVLNVMLSYFKFLFKNNIINQFERNIQCYSWKSCASELIKIQIILY